MDVISTRLAGSGEADGALMIEFDEHHRAVNAVIKYAVGSGAADPGEVGLIEMLFDLGHPNLGVSVLHVADP